MAKKAFIIASDRQYLKYAVSGAEKFVSSLIGSGYEVIPNKLSGDNINSKSLLSLFESMISSTQREDTVIFYFSGHGEISEKDNKTLFFILNESDLNNLEETAISFTDIHTKFRRCSARNKMIILDCCRATSDSIDFGNTGNYALIKSSDSYTVAHEDNDLKSSFLTYYMCEAFSSVEAREESLSFYSLVQILYKKLHKFNIDKPKNSRVSVIQTGRISDDFEIVSLEEVKVNKLNIPDEIIKKKRDDLVKLNLHYSSGFKTHELRQFVYKLRKEGYLINTSIDQLFMEIGLGNEFLYLLMCEDKLDLSIAADKLACSLRNENIIKEFCKSHPRIKDILKRLNKYV